MAQQGAVAAVVLLAGGLPLQHQVGVFEWHMFGDLQALLALAAAGAPGLGGLVVACAPLHLQAPGGAAGLTDEAGVAAVEQRAVRVAQVLQVQPQALMARRRKVVAQAKQGLLYGGAASAQQGLVLGQGVGGRVAGGAALQHDACLTELGRGMAGAGAVVGVEAVLPDGLTGGAGAELAKVAEVCPHKAARLWVLTGVQGDGQRAAWGGKRHLGVKGAAQQVVVIAGGQAQGGLRREPRCRWLAVDEGGYLFFGSRVGRRVLQQVVQQASGRSVVASAFQGNGVFKLGGQVAGAVE